MLLIHKLKQFERQIVFLRWATAAEFCKIKYVGADFIEVEIIDTETMEYCETILINPSLVLEVAIGGSEIGRVVAALSSKLTSVDRCYE